MSEVFLFLMEAMQEVCMKLRINHVSVWVSSLGGLVYGEVILII